MAGTAGDHEEIKNAAIRRETKRATALIRDHIQNITDIVLEQYI